jgi:hypothetical protein
MIKTITTTGKQFRSIVNAYKLYRNGVLVDKSNSNDYWSGKFHREDGPAVEWLSGRKEWWFDGKLHRLDGPAIEELNGYKEYWINGTFYSDFDVFLIRSIVFLLGCSKDGATIIRDLI